MLYFTRWKALAIILTALVVCLFAVPNFFPQERVKTWPVWAQRHIVLGLDLQGGSYLLLEVDSNYVKKEKLDQVRDEVRRVLPHWPRHRYLELSPKHWSATRARLRPEELAVPLSAFEIPPEAPASDNAGFDITLRAP